MLFCMLYSVVDGLNLTRATPLVTAKMEDTRSFNLLAEPGFVEQTAGTKVCVHCALAVWRD